MRPATCTLGRQKFTYKTVQTLPPLNAVFVETQRLHPAAPSASPRETVDLVTETAELQLPAKVVQPPIMAWTMC